MFPEEFAMFMKTNLTNHFFTTKSAYPRIRL